jgi:hypothetical protein
VSRSRGADKMQRRYPSDHFPVSVELEFCAAHDGADQDGSSVVSDGGNWIQRVVSKQKKDAQAFAESTAQVQLNTNPSSQRCAAGLQLHVLTLPLSLDVTAKTCECWLACFGCSGA